MEDTTRKKARVEKSDISRNDDATQSDENTLHSNYILHYDILRIIFQYLNGRDLENATMVCRSWSEAGNDEKWTRGPCHCFINPENMDSLLSYIKNIRIIPLAGFFFIPLYFNRHSVEDYIQNVLHEHCEIIILYSFGVFMDYDMRFSRDILCVFLPQVPNVGIESYKVTECYMEIWNIINMNVIREISKSNHETSACFMLFCNYLSYTIRNFVSFIKERRTFEIASISSIVLGDIYVPYKTSRETKTRKRMIEPNCIAVVITGPVQTWSVILEDKCNTQEHIESRLKLFKDKVKLKKHSIGFMFSRTCQRINEETKMAVAIFKRLFPNIRPLVGCFAEDFLDYGNFGKTTVDEMNEGRNDKDEHKCKEFDPWYYIQFYIGFLILTYG